MRCDCCNKNLNDYESTAKHAITGMYLNTCRKCLKEIGIPVIGNSNFNKDEEMSDEIDFEDFEDNDDDTDL